MEDRVDSFLQAEKRLIRYVPLISKLLPNFNRRYSAEIALGGGY